MSTVMRHTPGTAAEAAAIVRDSAASDRVLRLVGAGTWLEAGHPVKADAELTTERFCGITSYRPEDLTLSAGAGTTLAELDAATRPHGQWCPLLPWGDDRGTLGATIATATSGPFAERLGRPRNLVLGLECVDGTGRIVAAGGRVVKNVAGFDLTRAVTGSWGTLALITQVHLRLRARPVIDETWMLRLPVESTAAMQAFARGPLAPLACFDAGTGDGAGPTGAAEGGHTWYVRIGGNRAAVDAAVDALQRIAAASHRTATPSRTAIWDDLRRTHAAAERTAHWRWDPLSLRLRERFDPSRVLNRGLLGEPA